MALVLQKFNRVRDNSGRGFLSSHSRLAVRCANERVCLKHRQARYLPIKQRSQTAPARGGIMSSWTFNMVARR